MVPIAVIQRYTEMMLAWRATYQNAETVHGVESIRGNEKLVTTTAARREPWLYCWKSTQKLSGGDE